MATGLGLWSNQLKKQTSGQNLLDKPQLKKSGYSAAISKQVSGYMTSVPHGYENKAHMKGQCVGVGKEWNTAAVYQNELNSY
jgi:hypothetical protein